MTAPASIDVVLAYPKMAIYPDGPGWRKTADEPFTATIQPRSATGWRAGPPIVIVGDLPPTRVKQLQTRHLFVRDWMVDACVGTGQNPQGSIRTELPEELTIFQRWGFKFTMVAQSIVCKTTVHLVGIGQYVGPLKLDACPISILSTPMYAAPVTAAGRLVLVAPGAADV